MPDDDQMLAQGTVDFRNEARRPANQTDQLFTVPAKLTERQQYVYAITKHAHITPLEAGTELHKRQRCPYCTPEQPCQYAEANGREVLEALKRKGLLRRNVHHVYRRTADSTNQLADTDPFPPGF